MCTGLVNSFRFLEASGRVCFVHGERKLGVKKKQAFYFISKLCLFKVKFVLCKKDQVEI